MGSQLEIQGGQGRGRKTVKAKHHGYQPGSLSLVVLADLLCRASIIVDHHRLLLLMPVQEYYNNKINKKL